jgi:hypothetical protein
MPPRNILKTSQIHKTCKFKFNSPEKGNTPQYFLHRVHNPPVACFSPTGCMILCATAITV